MKSVLYGLTLLLLLLKVSALSAQSPYGTGATRPPMLSPYLNLTRGGAPVANYLFGARAPSVFGQIPQVQQPVGPTFGGFLPQSQIPIEAAPQQQYEPGGQPIRLASPAHPVVYGNQFANHGSYFSVYAPNVSRAGFAPSAGGSQAGMAGRSSASGLGTITQQPRGGGGMGGQQPARRPPSITTLP